LFSTPIEALRRLRDRGNTHERLNLSLHHRQFAEQLGVLPLKGGEKDFTCHASSGA
jgi:hypothetical protein